MLRRAAAVLLLSSLVAPDAARAAEIVRRFGRLTVAADTALAYPGGILVVSYRSARALGGIFAIFEGRRAPVYWSSKGARSLVPIPAGTPAGTGLLGIEVHTRGGAQRLQMEFPIAERTFPARGLEVAPEKRALLEEPSALRDGRRLMVAVRTLTKTALWDGPFRPPVVSPPSDSFGDRGQYVGASPLETLLDGGLGDRHRGLDYPLAPGSLVVAPAGGTVVMATTLALSGHTLVIDHGQGFVSALYHLRRIDVREGERVAPRAPLGVSGDSGVAAFPQLHWGVYLFGIAVDPQAVMALFPE
jgi:hypothetical protein